MEERKSFGKGKGRSTGGQQRKSNHSGGGFKSSGKGSAPYKGKPRREDRDESRASDSKPYRKPYRFDRSDDRSEHRRFDKESKPYRPERSNDRNDKKRFDNSEKPYRSKRTDERHGDRPFSKDDKPFRKKWDRDEKPYRKDKSFKNKRRFTNEGENNEERRDFKKRSPHREKGYGKPSAGNQNPGNFQNRNPKHQKSESGEYVRLNKFIANSGSCSRREADEFIAAGVVKVNGKTVTELGTKIKRSDEVNFDGKIIRPERKVYLLLNKPKDFVTTMDDPHAERTVMDLVKNACEERIYPVGRLDRNSTGVLLFTNDGELTKQLTHPKYMKRKIYHVHLDKAIIKSDLQKIVDGVELEDGFSQADVVSHPDDEDKTQVGVEIHSGKNRIIRRMFEAIGYKVIKLDRVYFAGLTKKNLPRGRWRFLAPKEINLLKMNAFG